VAVGQESAASGRFAAKGVRETRYVECRGDAGQLAGAAWQSTGGAPGEPRRTAQHPSERSISRMLRVAEWECF